MPWVKLSDDWANHPKFADPATGALCQLLHARSLCYAGRYLTDGFLPTSIIPALLSGFNMLALVNGMRGEDVNDMNWPQIMCEASLWETTEGGYQIHDYLTYNPSKKKVETARKLQAQGGKRSQEIQHLKSYHQGQPQGSTKVGLQLSPVPVSEKKEKKLRRVSVDNSDNPRSPVLASPSVTDRTTHGLEHIGSGLAHHFAQMAQDEETTTIVHPET